MQNNKRCCWSYSFRQIATPYFVPKAITAAVLFRHFTHIRADFWMGLVAGGGGGKGGGGWRAVPCNSIEKLKNLNCSYRRQYIKFGGNISYHGLNYFLDEI
jgi:hypothetical protein